MARIKWMNFYVLLDTVPVTQMLKSVFLELEGKMFLGGYQLGLAEMVLSEGRETSTYLSDHLISFLSLFLFLSSWFSLKIHQHNKLEDIFLEELTLLGRGSAFNIVFQLSNIRLSDIILFLQWPSFDIVSIPFNGKFMFHDVQ